MSKRSARRAKGKQRKREQPASKGMDVSTLNAILENSPPRPSTPPQRLETEPPKQFDYSSLSKLKVAEWIGLVGLFVSLAAAFLLGALAAAGIVDLGLANMMLVAALLVLVIGAVVVEGISRRSTKRILIST